MGWWTDPWTWLAILLATPVVVVLVYACYSVIRVGVQVRRGEIALKDVLLGAARVTGGLAALVLFGWLWFYAETRFSGAVRHPHVITSSLVDLTLFALWAVVTAVVASSGLYGVVASFAVFGRPGIGNWRHRLPVVGPFVDEFWILAADPTLLPTNRERVSTWARHELFSLGLLAIAAVPVVKFLGLTSLSPMFLTVLFVLVILNPARGDGALLEAALTRTYGEDWFRALLRSDSPPEWFVRSMEAHYGPAWRERAFAELGSETEAEWDQGDQDAGEQ